MLGICGGNKEKGISLGDLVFAETSFNYEEGKVRASSSSSSSSASTFEHDTKSFSPSTSASKVAKDLASRKVIPNLLIGTMISGAAVRLDLSTVIEKTKHLDQQILALDIEASAFYEACTFFGVVPLGVIKGVSDLGDSRKDDKNHQECMDNCGRFFLHFSREFFGPRGIKDAEEGHSLAPHLFREQKG
jgi:nucleoside phosphorylase